MSRKPKKDRSLSELELTPADIEAFWKRNSAGGEMKSAIKHFLDFWEENGESVTTNFEWYFETELEQLKEHIEKLKKSLEGWCNVRGFEEES